ncbi:uncharacterized protein LOC134744619 isoform X3 [Cydia strobilella]|uniref:uncharacterized protein LOC134744619 isoform X3 n=1 Tax=Cydia strobilella TaxID=1100964 RepID=UPI003003CA91
MLFISALAIGMVTGLQNATTDVAAVSDVTGAPRREMVLDAPKLAPPSQLDNVTVQDRPSMWDMYLNPCGKWRPINHIFFQVANVFFLLSFLAPHTPTGLIWLRVALILGCTFSGIWAWSIECHLDAVLWNSAFVAINFVYFSVHFYLMRPIKFHKDIEEVYVALFKPLRVSRRQFRRVLRCMRNVRHLKCHELYAHEKVTKVDSLSLVLSGKLVVSQNQRALHIVFPHHFLDSPEWFGVSTDEYFQVSIMAMEESRVLVWHRDKLKLSIMSDAFLQAVFDHILGRDVVHKLMQVSETMAVSNGHLPNSFEEGEDKPMLVVKKSGDGPGITALLNRQLQGAAFILYNCARLETIVRTFNEKVDDETYPPISDFEHTDFSLLTQEDEWSLIFNFVMGFPSLINNSADVGETACEFRLHQICSFLCSMVRVFSQYYRRVRILTEPRKHLLPVLYARIHMLKILNETLKICLKILNIKSVTQM